MSKRRAWREQACLTVATVLLGAGGPAWAALPLPAPAPASAATTSTSTAELIAATGPAGNTYDVMFGNLSAQCQTEVGATIIGRRSSGSVENVAALLNNTVALAMVQLDVLHFMARTDDLSQIKVLLALHPEQVHLVVLRERSGAWNRVVDAVAGWFGRKPAQSLADLKGRKVAAWGGSIVTAQNIRAQAEVPFEVISASDPADAQRALLDGSADAVLAVGGAPLKWVETLDGRFRLLSIGTTEAARLKESYRQARISYLNLGQTDGSSVDTVATSAVMVTRDYKSPAMGCMLSRLRNCTIQHLQDLRSTGQHRSWWLVDLAAPAPWPRYEAGKMGACSSGAATAGGGRVKGRAARR